MDPILRCLCAEARSPRPGRNLVGGAVRAGDGGTEPEDAIAVFDLLLHRLPGEAEGDPRPGRVVVDGGAAMISRCVGGGEGGCDRAALIHWPLTAMIRGCPCGRLWRLRAMLVWPC